MLSANSEYVFRSHRPCRRENKETDSDIIRRNDGRDDECEDKTGDVYRLDILLSAESFGECGIGDPTGGEDEQCREGKISGIEREQAEKTKKCRRDHEYDEIVQHEAVHRDLVEEAVDEVHLIFRLSER